MLGCYCSVTPKGALSFVNASPQSGSNQFSLVIECRGEKHAAQKKANPGEGSRVGANLTKYSKNVMRMRIT